MMDLVLLSGIHVYTLGPDVFVHIMLAEVQTRVETVLILAIESVLAKVLCMLNNAWKWIRLLVRR